MIIFSRSNSAEVIRPRSMIGSGLLSAGLLSLIVGLAIVAAPDLLAYIVASFFIVTGISLLVTWMSVRR